MAQQVTWQARHAHRAALAVALGALSLACGSSEDPGSTGGSAGQAGAAAGGDVGAPGGNAGLGGTSADEDATAGGASTGEADADYRGDEPTLPCGRSSELCCPPDKTCDGEGLTCSDQFCLTCGPPPAPHEGCVNVATGALASAQQTFPANPVEALNDNDVCIAWGSGDYPDIAGAAEPGTWLQLDLGEVKTLDAMSFWVKQTPAAAEVTLAFAYSLDGVTWTPWPSNLGVTKRINDSAPWIEDFVPALTARYFKVTFVKSPSFVSMRELALYTCPAP